MVEISLKRKVVAMGTFRVIKIRMRVVETRSVNDLMDPLHETMHECSMPKPSDE